MDIAYRAGQSTYRLYQTIVPALAGAAMVVAGFLPWLMEPLQGSVTAWQIPVDVGWQLRFGVVNYGLFCLLCALYPFTIAYRAWKRRAQFAVSHVAGKSRLVYSCVAAAWLCCIPVGLWLWQCLFVDLGSVAQLTRQEIEYVLTCQHFGYSVISPLIPLLNPLALDPLSLYGRLVLLVDLLGIGPLLPVFSAVVLVAARKLFVNSIADSNFSYPISSISEGTGLWRPPSPVPAGNDLSYPPSGLRSGTINSSLLAWPIRPVTFVVGFLLLVIFGRAPLAFVCDYQAQHALYAGDYATAERWFGYASTLNPDLELLSSYHILRGQAEYFLHPDQDSIDSQAYLASAYLEQKDYLSADRELKRAWQSGKEDPWFVDEMSVNLTQLAIISLPKAHSLAQNPAEDSAALSWFDQLLYVDPHNVFGQYMIGRIQYDLHNYSQCEAAMRRVITLSQSTNILSSAYTYLALSSEGQGDYVDARTLLLQAVSLDPKYRNNTAREELSGLR